MIAPHRVVETDLASMCDKLPGELSALEGQELVIVGGAGFLGYYLVQLPLYWNAHRAGGEKINVTVCDNFSRGMPQWLEDLSGDPCLTLMRHDVCEPFPESVHADYIIHAASIASPIYYRKHPIATMDANVNGFRNLIEYCMDRRDTSPVSGFLYYSTSEIYGDPTPENIPTPETYRGRVSCTGPRACYDESKRYGETLAVNFARQHGLPIKIARPFNNYGPGLKITDRRVLPDFARNILDGEDIVLLSDGSPSRTFCYISDAIPGYYQILMKGRPGEPYNIGETAPEISILELANRMVKLGQELFGYEGKVVHKTSSDPEYLVDNPNRRCPVIDKAHEELGYETTMPLDEGLLRSMLWYTLNDCAQDA